MFPTPAGPVPKASSSSPSVSSARPGTGTYSRQSTGAPSWKDLTGRGVVLFKEKISMCPPWPLSVLLATCVIASQRSHHTEPNFSAHNPNPTHWKRNHHQISSAMEHIDALQFISGQVSLCQRFHSQGRVKLKSNILPN